MSERAEVLARALHEAAREVGTKHGYEVVPWDALSNLDRLVVIETLDKLLTEGVVT